MEQVACTIVAPGLHLLIPMDGSSSAMLTPLLKLQKAVSILSDVRLNRDYTSKILQAISLFPSPYPLILKYLRTSKPLLTEPDDIELYTVALAESSIGEAWEYQRTFPERSSGRNGPGMRARLLRKIIWWSLERKHLDHFATLRALAVSLTNLHSILCV